MIPSKLRSGAGILLLASIALPTSALRAQQAEFKVLNHGPVHEAYASPVTYDPEPGVVVAARPPAPIRETPPAYRPEGRATVWVPGYWSWSDSHENYIWVSGLWRAVPPGRAWVPGYWASVSNGFQWVSGYWGDASQNQILYLPAPPKSLEQGPTSAAPDEYSIWAPGNWVWSGDDYAWQPGYWIEYSADWVWVPAEYAWTPSGFIFVDGYWDYALARRGLLCAPILLTGYAADFVYTPTVVVTSSRLVQHFFCRPAYRHYYFGNYYDPGYFQQGFYPWFAFHQSRYGYDPIYAQYSNYYQRQNNDWFVQNRNRYGQLRQDRALRPASYFNQTNVNTTNVSNTTNISNVLAQDLSQVVQIANQRQGGIRYTQIDQSQRNQLALTAVKVQQAAQQRARAEAEPRQQQLTRPEKRERPAAVIRGDGEQAAPARPQAPQLDKTRKRDTNVQRPAPKDVLERDPKEQAQPRPPVQGEQPKTAPPKELPKAIPPKELPKEQPKAAPPKELPKAAPPKELPKAAPPKELPKAAPPPKEVPKAAPKAPPPPPKAAPKPPPPKEQPKAAPKDKDDEKSKSKGKGKNLKDD